MGNVGLLLSFLLLCGTMWIASARFRMRTDSNWPLVYYTVLVSYLNSYDLVLLPWVVYAGALSAIFQRFEFLNERFVFGLRLLEVCALAHVGLCLARVLQKAM